MQMIVSGGELFAIHNGMISGTRFKLTEQIPDGPVICNGSIEINLFRNIYNADESQMEIWKAEPIFAWKRIKLNRKYITE